MTLSDGHHTYFLCLHCCNKRALLPDFFSVQLHCILCHCLPQQLCETQCVKIGGDVPTQQEESWEFGKKEWHLGQERNKPAQNHYPKHANYPTQQHTASQNTHKQEKMLILFILYISKYFKLCTRKHKIFHDNTNMHVLTNFTPQHHCELWHRPVTHTQFTNR